jgi:hypothetical protein
MSQISRRAFVAALAVETGLRPTALLADPRFERGLRVWKPAPGSKKEEGTIRPPSASGEPVWGLAQWYSRFTLADARREPLPSGSSRYFDGAKAVTFGAAGSAEADIILALNGHAEYGEHAPAQGDPWPHLLVEQPLVEHPAMAALESVPFRIEYRLLKSRPFHLPGWDDRRHTAQFLLYITIQNLNRQSAGFGDYLWFGVPMYDARYRLPRHFAALDRSSPKKRGTGKFIYNPAGEVYATKPAQDGDWVAINKDLLPLMREALTAAWDAGYLQDSRDAADYRLGSMNMGWEVTGPLDVAMQIRNLEIAARRDG